MTLEFRYQIPSGLLRDLERAPAVLSHHMDKAAHRGAFEGTDMERKGAPKFTSQLTNSIVPEKLGPAHYRFGPATDYAPAVEQGTGRGGFPPIRGLMRWLRTKGIQPDDPTMSDEDLAFVMARSIVRRGTPAQPFVAPVAKELPSRLMELLQHELDAALREARLT